jgi:hypothetical protein
MYLIHPVVYGPTRMNQSAASDLIKEYAGKEWCKCSMAGAIAVFGFWSNTSLDEEPFHALFKGPMWQVTPYHGCMLTYQLMQVYGGLSLTGGLG